MLSPFKADCSSATVDFSRDLFLSFSPVMSSTKEFRAVLTLTKLSIDNLILIVYRELDKILVWLLAARLVIAGNTCFSFPSVHTYIMYVKYLFNVLNVVCHYNQLLQTKPTQHPPTISKTQKTTVMQRTTILHNKLLWPNTITPLYRFTMPQQFELGLAKGSSKWLKMPEPCPFLLFTIISFSADQQLTAVSLHHPLFQPFLLSSQPFNKTLPSITHTDLWLG